MFYVSLFIRLSDFSDDYTSGLCVFQRGSFYESLLPAELQAVFQIGVGYLKCVVVAIGALLGGYSRRIVAVFEDHTVACAFKIP